MISDCSSEECVNIVSSRTRQRVTEESFQTKKELYSIYLQEAKLRRELETPIDDEKPSPLRTYQRLEHELAERRTFFSFNGMTRCQSLPSIFNPGLHTQKQQSPRALKGETAMLQRTPSIKEEPLFTPRVTSSLQELAKSLRDISDSKASVLGLRATASCPGDGAAKKTKLRPPIIRRTKSELPRTSKQRWKIVIHRRLPTVI